MKPYSPVTLCEKCGHTEASSTWRGTVAAFAVASDDYRTKILGPVVRTECRDERIERVCLRCGWTWPEAVLTPWTPVEKD